MGFFYWKKKSDFYLFFVFLLAGFKKGVQNRKKKWRLWVETEAAIVPAFLARSKSKSKRWARPWFTKGEHQITTLQNCFHHSQKISSQINSRKRIIINRKSRLFSFWVLESRLNLGEKKEKRNSMRGIERWVLMLRERIEVGNRSFLRWLAIYIKN